MNGLPLFPLSSIVLPGGRLPLRIFEPRYLSMVSACLKGDQLFGICLIADGAEVGTPAKTFAYGTLVKIVDWDQEDTGLLVIVAEGKQRFRIASSAANADGLLVGDVELLPAEHKVAIPAEYVELAELLRRALDQVGPLLEYTGVDFSDAVWVSSRLVELLPMTVSQRHELVAMSDSVERLSVLHGIVAGSSE